MSQSAVDVIIVGAGPAGSSLAIQLRKFGIGLCLLDRTGKAGGLVENAYSINNYLGLEPTNGKIFVQKIRDSLQRSDIGITKASVLAIEQKQDGYFVVKTNTDTFLSSVVVLAAGTIPVEYKEINKVYSDKIFYELGLLVNSSVFKKSDKILIIGGGESAYDYSLSLSDMKKNVIICIRGNCSKVHGTLKKEVGSRKNIDIKYNYAPGDVEKLVSEQTLILSAIGRRSALSDIEIKINRSDPCLFIIGDAKHGSLGQIGMAVGDGIRTATEILEIIRPVVTGVKCEDNIFNAGA